MSEAIQRNARMRRLGLGTATMEGRCRIRHADYLKKHGYRFCPWCAELLAIKHHCDHCNRDFTSDESFVAHQTALSMYVSNRCPNEPGTERHVTSFLKRRNKMWCATCSAEYPVKTQNGAAR